MITNTSRGVANIYTSNPLCPKCGHRILYHVTGQDDLVNPNKQSKAMLTGCFVTGCGLCPNYVGGV